MKRVMFWLLLVVPVGAGGAYYILSHQQQSVAIVGARMGRAVELVYATGFVEAEQPVSIAARITAPVRQVLVKEGAHVRRGQPLVLLSDEEQKDSLAQAAAQRRGAALEEGRMLVLFSQGWVTKAARDQAVATADAARAAERTARARMDQMVVRSGIDGIVLRRDVEPGDLATPARTLMLLGDPARIRVTATVDERDVPRVHIGQQALMSSDAWPDRVIRGHVREVTPGGDPEQRAFRARLALDDSGALPLGLTLEVNIVTRQVDRALLVPASSLAAGRVWVVRDGRAYSKPVRVGIKGASEAQILSGLKAGDRLIDMPPDGLANGRRVKAALR